MADDAPRLYIALYADADVHGKFVLELRKHGYDAISSREAKNDDLKDPQQLEFAVSRRRALITHNTQDFQPLHQKYLREDKTHYASLFAIKSLSGNYYGAY